MTISLNWIIKAKSYMTILQHSLNVIVSSYFLYLSKKIILHRNASEGGVNKGMGVEDVDTWF